MAYEYTEVAPEKSQNQIRKLLSAHGAKDMQIASRFDPPMEGFRSNMMIDGKPYAIKLVIPLREKKSLDKQEQEARRVWRVLYHHMKAIFEAADSGVIELRELLLPFFVTGDGRTVGEILLKDLQKKLDSPTRELLT